MSGEVEPGPEIQGFGNYLLWLLATRAPDVVHRLYEQGRANVRDEYRVRDSDPLPTPSAVAWLIIATELGVPPESLPRGDEEVDRRQHRIRTEMSKALNDQPRAFKEKWLIALADSCGFTDSEVGLLRQLRNQTGYDINPAALREAVGNWRTRRRESQQTSSPAPGAGVAPRMLPRDIESFVGRERELRRLVDTATRTPSTAGVVAVHAVEGMGGIGKTALALRAAHLIIDRFPDGQLFLDLQGYTPDVAAIAPDDALRSLLYNLNAPDDRIPEPLADRAAFYRDLLASKKVLIVLDNAATLGQIEPLLPGSAGCLVIVTSRHPIGLAGARVVPLGALSRQEAIRLFRVDAGPDRVGEDDPHIGDIAELCGYLPLAISILAARLARGQFLNTRELLDALCQEHDRLDELAEGQRSVTAAFELSYRHLPDRAQQMFQRLGLVPGADFDRHAVMSLLPRAVRAEMRADLSLLLDHNLLIPSGRGRYRFHDLVRVFARRKAESAGQDGLDGLLDYYVHCTQAAVSLLPKRVPNPAPYLPVARPREVPELATTGQAQEWLTTELPNLDAALREAAAANHQAHAVALAAALAEFLRASGRWRMASELHRIALQAAVRLDDLAGQAAALVNAGVIERQTGELQVSIGTLTRAVAVARDGSRPLALGGALLELGLSQRIAADPGKAYPVLAEALAIYEAEGSTLGRACALRELGGLRRQTSEFTAAGEYLGEASALYRELGDHYGEAAALMYLGGVRLAVRAYESASEALTRARDIYHSRGLDDQIYLANCLLYLGMADLYAGRNADAKKALAEGLEIYRRWGDRRGEAGSMAFLGKAHLLSGDYELAGQSLSGAIHLFQETDDAGGEAETWNIYAEVALASGVPQEARERYGKALALAQGIASGRDEADARDGLARCYLAEALALFESMECHDDAARIRRALSELSPPPP